MNPATYCWWYLGVQICSGGSPQHAPFYDPPYNPPPAVAALAPDACDFEHHPDRVTPPPAPQYRPLHAPPAPHAEEHTCHVVLERRPPETVYQAVEICALTPDKEAAIRRQMEGGQ